jgi:hypothetical protein
MSRQRLACERQSQLKSWMINGYATSMGDSRKSRHAHRTACDPSRALGVADNRRRDHGQRLRVITHPSPRPYRRAERSIHPASLAASYAQDRLGAGQIARVLPSWHRAIYQQKAFCSPRFIERFWKCWQDGEGTDSPGKKFDHEGSHVVRAAKTNDDRGGRVCAASRPLDTEPVAQLGSRSARDVVIFLVTAVSARRRRRVVAPDSHMTIRKQPSGRFYAVLKTGRSYVAGRTFDTKRAAQAWLARERAALAGGVDPRAGRATVGTLLPVWLDERKHSVSAKTYTADAALPRLVPTALAALSINAVTDREITRALIILTKSGFAESSVRRFRDSLSSFFAWAVRERMIAANPVTPTRVPRAGTPRVEMFPFSEEELERLYVRATARDQRLADLLLIAGLACAGQSCGQ